MPPYLAFQLYSVASEMPCLQARSAVFAPRPRARAQNRNDLIFREPAALHRPSLQQGRTLILHGGKTPWQVGHYIKKDLQRFLPPGLSESASCATAPLMLIARNNSQRLVCSPPIERRGVLGPPARAEANHARTNFEMHRLERLA
jgi:hypothetical protein